MNPHFRSAPVAVLALAGLAGCAAPGGESLGALTDTELRRLAIEEARGAPMRGLRLTDLLRSPPREPGR